ncbi:MAG: hypothetical protein Q8R40_00690 [bacterium]|nr:hypothetical protein [bacterium]
MIDNIIAGLLKIVQKHGPYPIFFGTIAILFPAIGVAAGSGYAWHWGFFHAALMAAAILLPSWSPPSMRTFAKIIGYTAAIILFFGIFNATKPLGLTIGFAVGFIGLVYVGAIASSLALTYGLVVAPTSDETVESAQTRGTRVVYLFISIAAWELFAAWYVTTLGQYLSLQEGIFVLCAAGVVLYGGIAWDLFGKNISHHVVYYTDVGGLGLKTLHAVYRLIVGNEIIDGNIAVSTRLTDFFKAAAQIDTHSLEWFVGVTGVLAVAFLISSLTGKKAILQMTAKILGIIVAIAFLAWFGWFGGMELIQARFEGVTSASLGFKQWALILVALLALARLVTHLTKKDVFCRIAFYTSMIITGYLVITWVSSWPHPVLSVHTWDKIMAVVAPEEGLRYSRVFFWIMAVIAHVAIIRSGLRGKVDLKRKVRLPGVFPSGKVIALFLLLLLFDWMWWNGGTVLRIHEYITGLWGIPHL